MHTCHIYGALESSPLGTKLTIADGNQLFLHGSKLCTSASETTRLQYSALESMTDYNPPITESGDQPCLPGRVM